MIWVAGDKGHLVWEIHGEPMATYQALIFVVGLLSVVLNLGVVGRGLRSRRRGEGDITTTTNTITTQRVLALSIPLLNLGAAGYVVAVQGARWASYNTLGRLGVVWCQGGSVVFYGSLVGSLVGAGQLALLHYLTLARNKVSGATIDHRLWTTLHLTAVLGVTLALLLMTLLGGALPVASGEVCLPYAADTPPADLLSGLFYLILTVTLILPSLLVVPCCYAATTTTIVPHTPSGPSWRHRYRTTRVLILIVLSLSYASVTLYQVALTVATAVQHRARTAGEDSMGFLLLCTLTVTNGWYTFLATKDLQHHHHHHQHHHQPQATGSRSHLLLDDRGRPLTRYYHPDDHDNYHHHHPSSPSSTATVCIELPDRVRLGSV